MEYCIGDKVKVVMGLRDVDRKMEAVSAYTPGVNSDMERMEGMICTISNVRYENVNIYELAEDEYDFDWIEEFFSPVECKELEVASDDELEKLLKI